MARKLGIFGPLSTFPAWKPTHVDCIFCDSLLIWAAEHLRPGFYEETFSLPGGSELHTIVALTTQVRAYKFTLSQGDTVLHCHSSDLAIPTIGDISTVPMGMFLEAILRFFNYCWTRTTSDTAANHSDGTT
jgi:hypothetical protein